VHVSGSRILKLYDRLNPVGRDSTSKASNLNIARIFCFK